MTTLQKVFLLCLSIALLAEGFAPASPLEASRGVATTSALKVAPVDMFHGTTSTTIAAATLDPTTVLSDVLGAFVNSNAILLVPVVAALAVASLVAWGIVAYASPAADDDEY